ncbi:hypothetical protein BUALT_Bualt13G0028600 [Buddleja alternifolia]|uniref:Uncharacterized protein n=1 Tax=Buddleja alternifolia TaxID=168488 RepID=A0AAV6WJY8_9LAMI|nr:hypothetical protein BUALT_Bualt13G0028600 [Buddleja alternifolia]
MASKKRSTSNDADLSALYKEWDEASCSVCMDHPHNAVLLICSSHYKGCRSYICDTSYRHSNCLDRFKKLKQENSVNTSSGNLDTNMENSEEGSKLRCPLCRGNVLGWKIQEDSRKYLNMKSRSCSRESCSFVGNYRELRKHARRVHPTVHPAYVDPSRQRAWNLLEGQREYDDTVSAVQTAMPGATVVGDYVIESGDRLSAFFMFQMIGSIDHGSGRTGGRSRALQRHRRENMLGFRDNVGENDDIDLNIVSGVGNNVRSNPRRRRRLTRARLDENQQ